MHDIIVVCYNLIVEGGNTVGATLSYRLFGQRYLYYCSSV